MRVTLMVLFLVLGAGGAGLARAGAARCWYEHGAIVVSAAAGDIADDFILDLSSPTSLLHDTRAQSDGIGAAEALLPLRLAGERLGLVGFQVADLDARVWGFSTSIAGVIGADALEGHVVDVRFAPCRIRLWRTRPPPFRANVRLPLAWVGGVPTFAGAISDGTTARAGRLAIDTASKGLRIAAAHAVLSRAAPKGLDAASRSHPPAQLRAASFGGLLVENAPASLDPDVPAGVLAGVGDGIWDRYDLRIDLRRGVLDLRRAAGDAAGARAPQWAILRQMRR